MKEYAATVTIHFSVEAPNEGEAQERAQTVMDSINVTHPSAKWLGDVEFDELELEEVED